MADCQSCHSKSSCSHAGNSGQCMDEQTRKLGETLNRIKHKLFIMSGKGGVGKSSVTANLAAALVLKGFKTGILDVDLHGPNIPNLLGINSQLHVEEHTGKILPAQWNENLEVVSVDSLLQDRDQPVIWRGPMKAAAIQQFLTDVAWGSLDYLLIDSPPGTGDEHMTVLKAIPDVKSIVVTTAQKLSIADVRKALNFLREIKCDILGLVENMSGFHCPSCNARIDLSEHKIGEELAEAFHVPFLGIIPFDPLAAKAAEMGVPVVMMQEDSAAKTAFLNLAEKVVKLCNNEK